MRDMLSKLLCERLKINKGLDMNRLYYNDAILSASEILPQHYEYLSLVHFMRKYKFVKLDDSNVNIDELINCYLNVFDILDKAFMISYRDSALLVGASCCKIDTVDYKIIDSSWLPVKYDNNISIEDITRESNELRVLCEQYQNITFGFTMYPVGEIIAEQYINSKIKEFEKDKIRVHKIE